MAQRKIAVIGSGIAGLSAAWLLSKRHDVTLYEADDRIGGHSNTVRVDEPAGPCPVDTGFIVFNPANYPNLVALYDHLGVETAPTKMSFAVSFGDGAYEYSGSGLPGLFGQARNILNRQHWDLVRNLSRFLSEGRRFAAQSAPPSITLGAWLHARGYSQFFIDRHILPMAAAIWSTPDQQILDFPAASFFRFFANHELLKATGRAPWRTVRNGSIRYVERLVEQSRARIRTSSPVVQIRRTAEYVEVLDANGCADRFEDVVIGAHADQARKILSDTDPIETSLLGAFSYSKNRAVLHRDRAWMPKRQRLWSAWNYINAEDRGTVQVTYWMNRLQRLETKTNYFVTLNPDREISNEDAIARFDYEHPMFDARAMRAQKELWSLQGRKRTWFCGSYFGYGFHEDALQSGLAVAEQLGGVRRPWRVADESGRIHVRSLEHLSSAMRVAA